ncbi:MAG: choice-of-anchor M domain-containing protein [Phycisphaerae bacterium]|nr:choice-of-anchor M domain-containing protein [Phycisphaerae bacterium]
MDSPNRLRSAAILAAFTIVSAASGRIAIAGEPDCDYIVSAVRTVYFGIETPLPNPDHPVAVSTGHTDLNVPYQACSWSVEVSPSSGQISLEDALIYGGPPARYSLPSIPAGFEFIGAVPNQTFWILPQSQTAGVIFLGMSSESMSFDDRDRICLWNPQDPRGGANVPGKWIRMEIVAVRGPVGGQFSVWQTSGPGQVSAFVSTFDGGITEEDAIHLAAGSHAHMNWGFTAAGLYEVDFRLSTFVIPIKGDVACDCVVDLLDMTAFVEALLTPHGLSGGDSDCNLENADVNADGSIDGADIQAFVDLLI